MKLTDNTRMALTSRLFWGVLALKVAAGTLFGSPELTENIIPFVKYFVASRFDNPWEYFYQAGRTGIFPYPPGLLVVCAIPQAIAAAFGATGPWGTVGFLDLFLTRLPILAADITMYLLLATWFKDHLKKVLWLYWCSPIIFYINYYHGQLDAVPTALFLLCVYFMFMKQYRLSSIMLALGLTTKGHLFIILPFYLVYCWRQEKNTELLAQIVALMAGVYLLVTGPVLLTEGYTNLVLKAGELGNIFVLRYPFEFSENLNLLLAPAALFILFVRFCVYEKLNRDMAVLYFALVFVILVILVSPRPEWYYWSYPLLVYFFIKKKEISLFPFYVFFVFYFLYFLSYEKTTLFSSCSLVFPFASTIVPPINHFKVYGFGDRVIEDLLFTMLQSSLMVIAYLIYKEGVLSNELYKPKQKPIMIGIGGDSGAGKDTTVNCYRRILGESNCIVLSGDDYHKWPRGHQKWKVYTHLHARGNKLHAQLQDAIALRDGKSVEKVSYDHDTGQFTNPQKVDPNKIIFFVGLHPFYLFQMRNLYDIKIYIEPDETLRTYWKIKRDITERGYTVGKVLEQLKAREKDSHKFIRPQKQFADMIIQFVPVYEIDFDNLDLDQDIECKLMITVNNSICLDSLFQELDDLDSIEVDLWDAEDLKYQTMEVHGHISAIEVKNIAEKIIPNLYELITVTPEYDSDYFGVMQLVFLVYLSEISKYKSEQ